MEFHEVSHPSLDSAQVKRLTLFSALTKAIEDHYKGLDPSFNPLKLDQIDVLGTLKRASEVFMQRSSNHLISTFSFGSVWLCWYRPPDVTLRKRDGCGVNSMVPWVGGP